MDDDFKLKEAKARDKIQRNEVKIDYLMKELDKYQKGLGTGGFEKNFRDANFETGTKTLVHQGSMQPLPTHEVSGNKKDPLIAKIRGQRTYNGEVHLPRVS